MKELKVIVAVIFATLFITYALLFLICGFPRPKVNQCKINA
jgi:hypothetical protein